MSERLSVISGCMFSGKTSELQRQVVRARFAGVEALVFKPQIDNRFGKKEQVVSHNGEECKAIPVDRSAEILDYVGKDTTLVAIDEVQFFDQGIVEVVQKLLVSNIRVIIAGLPQDFRGEPFGPVPQLLALADQITLLTAICTYQQENGTTCGREATRTQRLIDGSPAKYSDPVILVGAKELYAARCPDHHFVPGKPAK